MPLGGFVKSPQLVLSEEGAGGKGDLWSHQLFLYLGTWGAAGDEPEGIRTIEVRKKVKKKNIRGRLVVSRSGSTDLCSKEKQTKMPKKYGTAKCRRLEETRKKKLQVTI